MAAKTETETKTVETKGTAWLLEVLESKGFEDVKGTEVRAILRKGIADGDVEPLEGGRYVFKGVTDPAVKYIIAALKEKASKPAKEKAEKAPAKPRTRKTKAAEAEELEDENEDEVDDLDDL